MTEVNYNGKEELLMADYEGISDSDLTSKYANTDFDITDAPSTYITNEQMTYAVTCKRLFPAGDTYICNDEGTYKKGHIYAIKVDGETKSWEDITPSDVKANEQNTFTAQNTFTEEILANKGMSSDGNIVANNSVFKTTDTTKDIVTQYSADEIVKENGTTGESGSTTVNIKLPSTSGTFAATKHSVIKNDDTTLLGQENKEDTWLITDQDAMISIGYRNAENHSSLSASKGFFEISNLDPIGASKITATPSQVLIEVQGSEETEKMSLEATKDDIKINNKSVEQRYLDLTGDAGTLTDGEYSLVTTYDDLIIRIAGVTYRQQSKPINGSGDYVFASRYYKQATSTTSKEKDDYIVVIKADKTWTLIIDKDNADNAILYSQAQALTQEQKNMACSNMGISQSYEVSDADNTTIIRFGNIVFQSATFTITGNNEKVWSFPVSYDSDKIPQCWLHDSGSATSANNSAGITEKTNSSMTVRTCGQDSQVTFFALGWVSKK